MLEKQASIRSVQRSSRLLRGLMALLADMQTLSRMTGKDFSGPTPVIKAPAPPSLDVGPVSSNEEQLSTGVKTHSRTSEGEGDGEEIIIGNIEDE